MAGNSGLWTALFLQGVIDDLGDDASYNEVEQVAQDAQPLVRACYQGEFPSGVEDSDERDEGSDDRPRRGWFW